MARMGEVISDSENSVIDGVLLGVLDKLATIPIHPESQRLARSLAEYARALLLARTSKATGLVRHETQVEGGRIVKVSKGGRCQKGDSDFVS